MATNYYGAIVAGGYVPTVEVWNGTSWNAQELPLPAGTNTASLTAVSCASATSCAAIGSYPVYNAENAMMAEIWNGTTWTAQTIPQVTVGSHDGTLNAISCAAAGNCTAVGRYADPPSSQWVPLAEHWNGHQWNMQDVPVPAGATQGGILYGISCLSTACTAAGITFGNPAGELPLITHRTPGGWTDSTPAALPSGDQGGLSGVSCLSASACFVAGAYNSPTSDGMPLAERLKGGTWSASYPPIRSTATSGDLATISCIATAGHASDCTAVGTSTGPNGKLILALADYWNGHRWAYQQTATPLAHKTLEGVSCVPGGTCEAVGSQVVPLNGYTQMLAEGT